MTPEDLWAGVDRLVDRAPGPRDLVAHGLELFAARLWRARGLPIPLGLARAELRHELGCHGVHRLLDELREGYDGTIVLVKGPAAAAYYGDPGTRPFHDIDVLVADARRLHGMLATGGYEAVGDERSDLHHLPTLLSPRLPLGVEVHHRLKWVRYLQQPSFESFVEMSVPFEGRTDDVLTLPAAEHAVLLAVHVWSHEPLTRVLRLIDVAAASLAAAPGAPASVARAWGLETLWRETVAAVEGVILESRRPLPVRLWGGGAVAAREATAWEAHLGRCLGPLFVLGGWNGVRSSASELVSLARPEPGEPWSTKLQRVRRQLRHPRMRRTQGLPEAARPVGGVRSERVSDPDSRA